MSDCSHLNKSVGARYLSCMRNNFCGSDDFFTPIEELQLISLNAPQYSGGNLCVYEFYQIDDATVGDVMRIDLPMIDHSDVYWAEGMTWEDAEGKHIGSPKSASFSIRYPNSLFLTLVNTQA